jgi:hypothetical protein
MHQKKDGILINLGLTDEALLQARAADMVLNEMCNDLEDLAQVIEKEGPEVFSGSQSVPDRELIRLISELETEVRLRLRSIYPFESQSQNNAEKD